MGRETAEFTVVVRLSRHNTDEDKKHDELLAELKQEVEDLCNSDRYEPIEATVF